MKTIPSSPKQFAASPGLYETAIDLPKTVRSELITLLNQHLADAIDLQLQLKQAHWNVKGPNFFSLHKLFDEAAAEAASYVDQIAERIAQLGGIANGTIRAVAAKTRLPEYSPSFASGSDHVEAVVKALSVFGEKIRAALNEATALADANTADLYTEISRGIDKLLWFVEAHTQTTH